jgi:hypothetical protein
MISFRGNIVDPACGRCHIVKQAMLAGHETFASDIVCRDPFETISIRDWLDDGGEQWDNIVSNPPFGLCAGPDYPFVQKCLDRSRGKVALLLPAGWLYGETRSRWLNETPLKHVIAITPRPSMPPGPVIEAGEAPGNGTKDFAWFVWEHGYSGPALISWCRKDD